MLTPYGEVQCRELSHDFPYHNNIDLLVCSPLRRTIYTTLLAFGSEVERGIKIIALPELQETSDIPCDTGSDVVILKQEMEGKAVDLSLLHEDWNSKKGRWTADASSIDLRAKIARQWLKDRPEKEIVVVTHGGFLHFFTEDWTDSGKFEGTMFPRFDLTEVLVLICYLGTGWANTEFRSYHLIDGDSDNISLVETEQSCRRRRGCEKSLTKTEQMELREVTSRTWESQGFQIPSKV